MTGEARAASNHFQRSLTSVLGFIISLFAHVLLGSRLGVSERVGEVCGEFNESSALLPRALAAAV